MWASSLVETLTSPSRRAFQEERGWGLTFDQPQLLYGRRRKSGDLTVAAARQGADSIIYENNCRVAGSEKQDDPVFSNGHALPLLARSRDWCLHGSSNNGCQNRHHDQCERAWNPAVLQSTLEAPQTRNLRNR